MSIRDLVGAATALAAPTDVAWRPDVLGTGYQQVTLPLAADDEGEVVATLVRYRPKHALTTRRRTAVLYLHGWNDYFFQTGLAEFWHAEGAAFYALDLRKYGRSLREYQRPTYVDDLAQYDEDIGAALAVIRQLHGPEVRVVLMGHSTGGLVLSLWMHRHPGQATALVLNSPWLELQGSAVLRTLATPALTRLARYQPHTVLPFSDPGHNARTMLKKLGGEWEYNTAWRPTPAFPIRAGWLHAVVSGHATVAKGLEIAEPVLMMASARSLIRLRWQEAMRAADVVLDVDLLAQRAIHLGPRVTVVRVAGGLHDLVMSPQPVRDWVYGEMSRWARSYIWDGAGAVTRRFAPYAAPPT